MGCVVMSEAPLILCLGGDTHRVLVRSWWSMRTGLADTNSRAI